MARSKARFRLEGIRNLQRTLLALPNEIARKDMQRGMIDALEPMRQRAEDLAPDAEPFGVGLKQHIISSDKLTSSQRRQKGFDRLAEATVYMGVDGERPGYAPHALLVEFGTSSRFHESGKYVGEMPAQPFIRPAFDAESSNVLRRFGVFLGHYIEAAARRIRRT